MSASLYEWFDGEVRAEVRARERYASCSALTHHVGTLIGLGLGREEILEFVDRVLRVTEVMMTRVSDGNTLGQNMDAMLSRPALVSLDGGKETPP